MKCNRGKMFVYSILPCELFINLMSFIYFVDEVEHCFKYGKYKQIVCEQFRKGSTMELI